MIINLCVYEAGTRRMDKNSLAHFHVVKKNFFFFFQKTLVLEFLGKKIKLTVAAILNFGSIFKNAHARQMLSGM